MTIITRGKRQWVREFGLPAEEAPHRCATEGKGGSVVG